MHLRRRFAVGRHLEFKFEAIEGAFVTRRHDEIGRTQQGHRARSHRLAQTAIDLSAHALCQEWSELILRAPQHRGTGDDVFRNRMLHEEIGRNDRDFAARHRLIIEHAARATPMVGMGVGKDDSGHRASAAMSKIELHRGAGAFDRGQRIHHDDAVLALDQRHVGNIEAANLIDARHHLENPVIHVEARLPPQTRVNGRGRFRVGKKTIGLEAPDYPALRGSDPRIFHRAEKAARCILEIARVRERQRFQRRRMPRDNRRRCLLGGFSAGCFGHVVLPSA